MEKKVPYEILGYYLDSIIYSHAYANTDNIHIKAETLKKTDTQIDIRIVINLGIRDSEKSTFSYIAGFKVNNKEIDKSMNENAKISAFVAIIFPFIRESILNITKSIMLPLIDLRGANMEEGISFFKIHDDKKSSQ